jgi:hypothetical protein
MKPFLVRKQTAFEASQETLERYQEKKAELPPPWRIEIHGPVVSPKLDVDAILLRSLPSGLIGKK